MESDEPMSEEHTIRIDVPASHRYLNVLGGCIAELFSRIDGLHEPQVVSYNVQLAVQEICANIVSHAYQGLAPGRIAVSFTVDQAPRRLVVDVRDTGRSFDIDAVPEPNLEEAQIHGYGLFLVRQLMDEMVYTPQGNNNHWHLVKNL